MGIPGFDPVEIGLARQQTLADELTSPSAAPSLMIWRCRPALLVTRSETRLPRFDGAVAEMQTAGWPVLVRKSGGGACPVGPGTVQLSMIEAASPDATMSAKYAALSKLIQDALRFFQVVARTGSVAGAYCPGSYDLAVAGKKIAGMAQHWFRNRHGIRCIITTASINVEEPPDVLAGAVNRFYGSAGNAIRCRATDLTNMRLCGGTADPASKSLTAKVMNQLALEATMLGAAIHRDILPAA
jgi:lipoate-protein ligase A